MGKHKPVPGESSPSLPADACTTSVLLGGFTLHLDGEPPPQPPPPQPSPPCPSTSVQTPPSRLHFQQPEALKSDDPVDENERRDSISRFFSGLHHLSRGSGNTSGGLGGSWGSSSFGGLRASQSVPWQQHSRAFLRGLKQGRASLSSFLGFSGSGSDLSDNGAEDTDKDSSWRRTSNSPAFTDGVSGAKNARCERITEAGRGEGGKDSRYDRDVGGGDRAASESMGDSPSDTSRTHGFTQDGCGGTATAATGSLATLTIGQIGFEVRWKLPLRSRRRVLLLLAQTTRLSQF